MDCKNCEFGELEIVDAIDKTDSDSFREKYECQYCESTGWAITYNDKPPFNDFTGCLTTRFID